MNNPTLDFTTDTMTTISALIATRQRVGQAEYDQAHFSILQVKVGKTLHPASASIEIDGVITIAYGAGIGIYDWTNLGDFEAIARQSEAEFGRNVAIVAQQVKRNGQRSEPVALAVGRWVAVNGSPLGYCFAFPVIK